jgi:hypothetical protein
MAETIFDRTRRRLGVRLNQSTFADIIGLVSGVGAALTEVAGMLFGFGDEQRAPGPSAGAGARPPRPPAFRALSSNVRLGPRARRGSNTSAGRRLAAHALRCHGARRQARSGLGRNGQAGAVMKKFRA